MNKVILPALAIFLLAQSPAYAINERYRQQLERSGCTQVSEAQGCDITKTQAQNAEAGLVTAPAPATHQAPYAGQWVAKSDTGATVATLRVDKQDKVWVNGTRVSVKRTASTMQFRQGPITFTLHKDPALKHQDYWRDTDAGTQGPIIRE
ncbi:hypothetical protein SAMN04487857_113160 [Pseudomonas sp. ok272]|uniref:hypothetical protein n=1 Tax=unclassified Pseudomonas TaxID=196821 RepID=UPI0008CF8F72|nr:MULTISPECIES: hypothetical protein [unclassified Pseudomonas]SEN32275.1 hypothetical protein SAMN04487857_113160 [Pseudomonas sp. ok272]SFN18667.1 hypothetical protein SAMN04487858_11410 [Pseudomonas sp. ok602]